MAKSRHIYPKFIAFIKEAIKELQDKGHDVEIAGIFYHIGENEMSMPPLSQKSTGMASDSDCTEVVSTLVSQT